jgi:DNA-binding beta-propeller fold protein YncE
MCYHIGYIALLYSCRTLKFVRRTTLPITTGIMLILSALVSTTWLANSALASPVNYTFESKFGSFGSSNTQFDSISEVAVDSDGNIYAADSHNLLVKKFDNDGTFQYSLCNPDPIYDFCDTPTAVALDSDDNVYIIDTNHLRVLKFDADGFYLSQFPLPSIAPAAIDIDDSGYVYVAGSSSFDYGVQKFDSSGSVILQFCTHGINAGGWCGEARDVALDSDGSIYVADAIVQKFDSSGNLLYSLCTPDPQYEYCDSPRSVALDSDGNVYIADSYHNGRVLIFDAEGNYLTSFDSFSTGLYLQGAGIEQFFSPTGIDVDSDGKVYLSDVLNSRVLIFSPDTPLYNLCYKC